uniref:PiggyBac transposable element-derived protein domain-containing protein n=1 Tax=Biomphalaria glabrata TaxID=6526 RepID=A0A2C9K6K3_BIOGL
MDPASRTSRFANSQRHFTVEDVLQQLDDSDFELSDSDNSLNDTIHPSIAAEETNSQRHFTVEDVLQQLDDSDFELSDSDNSLNDTIHPSVAAEESSESENDVHELNEATLTKSKSKVSIKWRSPREPFKPLDCEWKDTLLLGEGLNSPSSYFLEYFQPEIFQTFAEQTNIFYLTKTGKVLGTTATEVQTFFGITILMANLGFPRIRMYWQKPTRVDAVADAMTVNRYLLLRQNIHIFAEQTPPPGSNKFWKVQPLIDAVRARCLQLPREEFSAVDEQMIPFTGRVPAKQFIKSKPNPVGVKNFVICGKSGRAIDFELYQGAGTGISAENKHLGLGASVVLRLAETIPQNKNYKICFDNYFTGISLIRELRNHGIQSLGVLKSNRLMGCPLRSEKELKKDGRGSMDIKVSSEGDVCIVRWIDNGAVTLASSFVGIDDIDSVRRWSESAKSHIQVQRPKCVQVYNEFMGGVDKMDFLISKYRTKAKTRKWPVRMIFHFMDFSLVNSWLEYRDIEIKNDKSSKNILDLLGFRDAVADMLCRSNLMTTQSRRPGRPKTSTPLLAVENDLTIASPSSKRARPAERPITEIRYDQYGHFPICIKELGQRCKLEGCTEQESERKKY